MAWNGSGVFNRVHNWVTDKTNGIKITASRMDAELDNYKTGLENCLTLDGQNVLSASLDTNGNAVILDADGDTNITAGSVDDRVDITVGGSVGAMFGHASGNTGAFVLVDPAAFTATASTDIGRVRVGNTGAVTVPTGTTAVAASLFVEEPNLTATGTITNAATVYIEAAPTEGGTGNFALWVDAGAVKFDGTLDVDGTVSIAGDLVHIGDTDNKIAFTTDAQSFETGGSSRLDISDSGVRLGGANARVTTILDEDNMASDSATALATQQSIKAYVDNNAAAVDVQTFTSSDTWNKPSTGTVALVEAWGAGGSGGRAPTFGGAGGGGGAYATLFILLSDLGATETVTVGAGGAAVTSGTTVGNAGGNTTFGSHLTAYGGGGGGNNNTSSGSAGGGGGGILGAGVSGPTSTTGGDGGAPLGGTGAGGDVDAEGSSFGGGAGGVRRGDGGDSAYGGGGGGGGFGNAGQAGDGGDSYYGGAGGGGGDSGSGSAGAGGTSVYGGAGGAGNVATSNATAGTAPGGGGGGAEDADTGAGAAGQVRVTVW